MARTGEGPSRETDAAMASRQVHTGSGVSETAALKDGAPEDNEATEEHGGRG